VDVTSDALPRPALRRSVLERAPGDPAWAAFTGWLVNAYCDFEAALFRGGYTGGGGPRPKTGKQRAIDRAVFEALAAVAADWPSQPLGATGFAVLLRLRAAAGLTERGLPRPVDPAQMAVAVAPRHGRRPPSSRQATEAPAAQLGF
jgi:hypothetical protein